MFNHVINMFSFRYTYQKSWAEDSAAAGSQEFQNCSTETWRNILHYGGKHGECSVLMCTQEQNFFSKYKEDKL